METKLSTMLVGAVAALLYLTAFGILMSTR